MIYVGVVLYALLFLLLVLFWSKARGMSLDDLLAKNEEDHHHVHRVIKKQPLGGAWREHQQWMAETLEKRS